MKNTGHVIIISHYHKELKRMIVEQIVSLRFSRHWNK